MDKNGYNASLLPTPGCMMCGRDVQTVRHEVFEGVGRRKLCKADGCWITLCPGCHERIHKSINKDFLWIKRKMELAWIRENEATQQDFINRYGRNYL